MNNFIGGALFSSCLACIVFFALIRMQLNKIVEDLNELKEELK
ncbi:hypothetical protein TPDSL_17790 [Terrisporobacter petrolearius]